MNCNGIVGSLCDNSKLHSWSVVIVIAAHIFVIDLLPETIKPTLQVIFPVVFIFLIIWGMINIFVVLLDRSVLHGKMYYSIRLVKTDELIDSPNFNEYTKLFFLFFAGQHSFDFFQFSGFVIYLSLAFFLIASCFIVLHRDYKRNRTWTTTRIGNLFLVICLLVWSKNTYSRIDGDESIGSFFEKPEYRTKYYVNLFPEASKSKNYRLAAEIHVYEESDEDYEGNSHAYKVISIEKVYFNNGGFLYFDDCLVEFGEKTYCIDQNGKGWYIELTNLKVK